MLLIFIAMINFSFADMFLKLDGQTILNHDYKPSAEFSVKIPDTKLVDDSGLYIYKYSGGRLVRMTEQEKNAHPMKIARDEQLLLKEKKEQSKERLKTIDCEAVQDQVVSDLCTVLK